MDILDFQPTEKEAKLLEYREDLAKANLTEAELTIVSEKLYQAINVEFPRILDGLRLPIEPDLGILASTCFVSWLDAYVAEKHFVCVLLQTRTIEALRSRNHG